MSHQIARNDPVPKNMVAEVARGALRSYWHMKCDQKMIHTQRISADNALKVPPSHFKAAESGMASLDPESAIKSSELDYETLTQNLESTQDPADTYKDGDSSILEGLESGSEDALPHLSGEQKAVLNIVLNGRKNIFFTGAAGTGKSVLLRCIISQLRRKHGRAAVGVTALTGIAACNIGGQTLHRFAGIGLGKDPVEDLLKRIKRNATSRKRWMTTQVLLIDEVSMLDVELLEKLDEIACKIRGNDIPFGGIQLICTGDLFQLPPVEKVPSGRRFCFETPIWDRIIDKTVNLTQVFRQSDPKFVNVLNELRLGHVSQTSEDLFMSLTRVPKLPKGIVPTQLFSTRREVTNSNQAALKRIVGTEYVYDCSDWKSTKPEAKYMDISRDILAEERLNLKIGAQVMLIKNIDSTLVNGSIGRVVAFMSASAGYTDYGANENKESHYRSRKVLNDVSNQGSDTEQVAKLLGAFGNSTSSARKRKLAEYMTSEEAKKGAVLPVVKFVTAQNTVRFMMVHPETWEITDFEGNALASRTQIPLILAWALSIHKSQGQTLPYVCVDLKNIFENGQAYVAISRATSVDGLQIMNFSRRKVRASEKVVAYYEQLENVQEDEIRNAEEFFAQEFKEHLQAKQEVEAMEKAADPEYVPESSSPDYEPAPTDVAKQEAAELKAKPKPRSRRSKSPPKDTLKKETGVAEYISDSSSADSDTPQIEQVVHIGHEDDLLFSEPDHITVDHIQASLREPSGAMYVKRPRIMIESSSPLA